MLNGSFYPQLSNYASASKAAQFVASTPEVNNYVAFKEVGSYGTDFYSKRIIPEYNEMTAIQKDWTDKMIWIYTEDKGRDEIHQSGLTILEEKTYDHFHISKLSINFVRPSTRQQYVDHRYLIKVKL
jgi:hypothetical protein